MSDLNAVIPAEAGIQTENTRCETRMPPLRGFRVWVPAFAGMTGFGVTLIIRKSFYV
jgi:hypothetical protein